MKTFPFTTPAVLKQQYARTSSPHKFEGVISILILVICLPLFWYWLVIQDDFVFGTVDAIQPVGNGQAVAQILNPAKQDFMLEEEDLLDSLQAQWVFAYGERVGESEPKLLYPDQTESLQMFLSIVVWPVKAWLADIAQSKYLAILIAGLLLLASGHAFRYAYGALMTLFVCFSAWHGMYVGKWLGLFSFDVIGLSGMLLVCGILSLRWSNTHSRFAFVESLMAMLIWVAFGSNVMAGFGLTSEIWLLVVFGMALVCPTVVSALLAAYFLGQAFDATGLGALILLLVCLALSATQMMGAPAVRRYAYQTLAPVRQRWFKAKRPWPKGRVSLHDFLNTPS